MPRVGRPQRLRQPTNPLPPPQDDLVLEGPTQFFDMSARDDEEGPTVRAPQIFDLSLRDDDPGREATIEPEATATIDMEDSTEQLIINLRKDIELKNATIRHLQNALEAKSMTIGILTRAARDGGCQQLLAELQAKTAAALQEKDEIIAGLRGELDDTLRLACVFGAASMVQPSPLMREDTAPAARECQEWQEQRQASPPENQRRVPSLGNPMRACGAFLDKLSRQAARLQNRGHANKCLASGYEAGMHQANTKVCKKMALQTSSWLQPITTCWAGLGKGAAEYCRPAVAHSQAWYDFWARHHGEGIRLTCRG